MALGKRMSYARGDLKIIPAYEDWLYKHSRDLKTHHEIIGKIIDRPERVREASFSASAAGQCLRKRQFAWMGAKRKQPEAKGMNIFVNGDFVHLRHQIAGLQMGYFTDAEVSVSSDQYNLKGTMDAVLDDGGVGEIKSINSNGFSQIASFGPKHDHVEQVHSYMLAAEADHARILYENKDTNELKEFLVKRSSATITNIVQDLELLNEATNNEKLIPPLGECIEGRGAFRSCQYRETCLHARFESPATVSLGPSIRVRRSTASD